MRCLKVYLYLYTVICSHHNFHIIGTITAYWLVLPYIVLLFKKRRCGRIKVEVTDIQKYTFLESSPITPDSVKEVIMSDVLYCMHVHK